MGHDIRLMPASYVKPYVRRNKTDAADATAICEAVSRPSRRFVAIKTVDQQAALMLHRSRDLLIRQRTMLVNALRAHMAELGIVAAQGSGNIEILIKIVRNHDDDRLPTIARTALEAQVAQYEHLQEQIGQIDAAIRAWHESNALSRRLATIPGIGPIIASALAATVQDGEQFRSGRDLAAWMKTDGRLDRNHLLGTDGDAVNALLVAAGYNLRQILRRPRLLFALALAWLTAQTNTAQALPTR